MASVLDRLDTLDAKVRVLDQQVVEVLDILLEQQTAAAAGAVVPPPPPQPPAPTGSVRLPPGSPVAGSAPVTDQTAEAICEAFSVVSGWLAPAVAYYIARVRGHPFVCAACTQP